MYKILITIVSISIFFIFFSPSLKGDETNKQDQTLFNIDEIKSGGYGGPEIQISNIKNELGLMVGGRGGWIINSSFSIGGGGWGLVTNHEIKDYWKESKNRQQLYNLADTNKTVYLRAGWGGLILEYINSSEKLVHFTVNLLVGAGGATYTISNRNNNDFMADRSLESSAFAILQPGIGVDLNITKAFRLEFGINYRLIYGVELWKLGNSDLSGLSGGLVFKFGKF
ncbi:MAG: hypothetical protein HW421_675 [Ignavibacteria bacterium]|nr:hypothetical protein [Ignavibacteria bacterium]